jgi:UTP--glucose-1-phosphate uridylyltransferase
MLPAKKAMPTELLAIYEKPLIEHVAKAAIDDGIREIILATRSGKDTIKIILILTLSLKIDKLIVEK